MIALITGASKGIGRAFATEFAKNGIDVILIARSQSLLDELAKKIRSKYSIKAYPIAIDLSIQSSAEDVYRSVNDLGLTVDFLVNIAGFGDHGYFADSNRQKQTEMINLNIITLTQLTHLFVQNMKEKCSGKILNVASTAAFQPGPSMSVYFATKSYVLSFSEAIAEELKPYNITVTALCPGPTESDFGKVSGFKLLLNPKKNKFPSSQEVAEFGYDKMMQGKLIAIHGFFNSIQATAVRFFPRNIIRKITHLKIK